MPVCAIACVQPHLFARGSVCLDLRGLMTTLRIWRSVGGRTVLFVPACSHKSVSTWCVLEVKLRNSDAWACVVSCGEAWISPACLCSETNVTVVGHWPLWRKWKSSSSTWASQCFLYFLCKLHGRRNATVKTPPQVNITLFPHYFWATTWIRKKV